MAGSNSWLTPPPSLPSMADAPFTHQPSMARSSAWFQFIGALTMVAAASLARNAGEAVPPDPAAPAAPASFTPPDAQERHRRPAFRRMMTSATSLRSMHVTHEMAVCLGLEGPDAQGGGAGTKSRGSQGPARVFRTTLFLRDLDGNVWPVAYEGTVSRRQYHRRMKGGWHAFCRYHGVRMGDAVEFRRGAPNNAAAMTARVVRYRAGSKPDQDAAP